MIGTRKEREDATRNTRQYCAISQKLRLAMRHMSHMTLSAPLTLLIDDVLRETEFRSPLQLTVQWTASTIQVHTELVCMCFCEGVLFHFYVSNYLLLYLYLFIYFIYLPMTPNPGRCSPDRSTCHIGSDCSSYGLTYHLTLPSAHVVHVAFVCLALVFPLMTMPLIELTETIPFAMASNRDGGRLPHTSRLARTSCTVLQCAVWQLC